MLYEAKHMERLYNADDVNTQFLHALFCQDYERNLVEEVLQKKSNERFCCLLTRQAEARVNSHQVC